MDVTDPRWRELLTEVDEALTAIADDLIPALVKSPPNMERAGAARDRITTVRDAVRRNGVSEMFAQCCPVCSGKGIVPNGFYRGTSRTWTTNSTAPETCRSCDGTGVVWPPKSASVKRPLGRTAITYYGPLTDGSMPVDLSVRTATIRNGRG